MKSFKVTTIFLLIALIVLVGAVAGQAQQSVSLDSLSIQVWPEYDRPETLVIYKGALAPSVDLPATLSFQIPTQVSNMSAVAIFDGETNNLVNSPYTFEAGTLTLTIESRQFQFEYYDPSLVVKADTQRDVRLDFTVEYPVSSWRLEFQQPLGASNVQLSPEADEVTLGSDQLTYHIFHRADTTGGETISVSGSYQKRNDTLTAKSDINVPTLDQNTEPVAKASGNNWLTAGYVLIGLGVLVLLVAGGVWFYRYLQSSSEPARRPAKSKTQVQAEKANRAGKRQSTRTPRKSGGESGGQARFCHQCGTEYKPGAGFCHNCGTPRR